MPYSYSHLLRIFQLIRLLSRDPKILELLISKGGVKIMCDKVKQLQPKVLEHPNDEEKPYASLLIEVISIAKRMYSFLDEHKINKENSKGKSKGLIDTTNNDDQKLLIEQLMYPLQTLLRCNNNVLLMCIVELMVNILSNKRNLAKFRDEAAIEGILCILTHWDNTELK